MNIEHGMEETWEKGCNVYTPVFRGEPMKAECCDPSVSLENLLSLLDAGLHPVRYRANRDRAILVEFAEGGSYLATGFSFGEPGEATEAFARFATAAHGASDLPHYNHLLGHDFDLVMADGGDIQFAGMR